MSSPANAPGTRTSNRATQAFRAARDFLLKNREDYEAAYKGFEWPKLDHFNWALDWFDHIAVGDRCYQTALWVVYEDGRETKLSFAELSQRSSQIANYFRELGVRRGDRILLILGNVPQLWETLLASMKLGAVVIPATTLLTASDLADRIERGRVRHIVCAAELAPKLEGIGGNCTRIAVGSSLAGWREFEAGYSASAEFTPDAQTRAGDPLQLYFTSGTTSKPKLVMHSHTSYPVGHLSTMYWIGLKPGDVHCNLSSPGWAKHAWSCVFAPWNAEATVFVLNQARFNARGLLDALTGCGVTTFCAPPTVWRMLITEDLKNYHPSKPKPGFHPSLPTPGKPGALAPGTPWKARLRELVSAGEPLNPEVIEQVRAAWGLTIRDGYGQTETTAQVGNPPGQKLKAGSMGRPLPGYRVVLLDSEGKQSHEGELSLPLDPPPAGLMPGYLGDDGQTITMAPPAYRTGDVVQRDAEGYLTFVGRADDVFKSSDYRISPFEVESALIEHPDVVECAVVPVPDPVRTALVKACVALRAGVPQSREVALSIFQHSRKVLAPYKRVRRLEFVELPKTISGKIRRVELRESAKKAVETRSQAEFREEDFPELR